MKTSSVAVAVAVVLAFIYIQESSAVPIAGVQEWEEPMSNDNPAAEHEEMTEESWKMPVNIRQKRSRGLDCKPYCYPTRDGVMCGVRCDF